MTIRARARNGLAVLLGSVVAVGALAIPAVTYTRLDGEDLVLDRHRAPAPSWSDEELARLVDAADPPPTGHPLILSYHDVRPDPPVDDRYTVTPEQLADHLALLRAMGYESISVDQLVAWLDGTATLPDRPVLVTFDDGASGLWRYADAVLEDQGFSAVAFPITGRVGTNRPYYLTWQELDRLRDSGRWDVESHTRMGHDRIVAAEDGTRSPFLINRAWLEDEDRLESEDEFADRVEADLTGSATDLVDHGFAPPRLFAYPFSAETNPTNDPAAPARTSAIVADRFEASMTNVVPDRLVTDRDRARRSLPRLEVFRATSVDDLHTRIVAATPVPPGPAAPLGVPADWTDSAGEPFADEAVTPDVAERSEAAGVTFGAGSLTLAPPDRGYLAANHAMGRSADWTAYEATVTIGDLGAGEGGPTGSLFALVGSDAPIQVAVSATYVRVAIGTDDATVLAEHALPTAESRRVAIAVRDGSITVVVDGQTIATAPQPTGTSGGIGLATSGGTTTFADLTLSA